MTGSSPEYSPYQNISANRKYPPVLMTTSTRRSRTPATPAMTAAPEAAGPPRLVLRKHRGGHAGAADNAQIASKSALSFAFLWRMLGLANHSRTVDLAQITGYRVVAD